MVNGLIFTRLRCLLEKVVSSPEPDSNRHVLWGTAGTLDIADAEHHLLTTISQVFHSNCVHICPELRLVFLLILLSPDKLNCLPLVKGPTYTCC